MNPFASPRKVTRRTFLRGAGGAVLAASGAIDIAAMSAKARTPSEQKLGFAFVGLGGFATGQLIPAIASCNHVRLAALVSGSAEKAKRIGAQHGVDPKNIYSYETYDNLKDNPDVDVIYIVLPNGMHAEYTIRGAKAGKHIMCEKPMANSVEECQAMIDACKAANKKLMIGYRCHYEATNLKAIELVRSGELGKLIVFNSDHGFRINDPKLWRLNKKLAGGGALMDIGIYALNAARYISGEEPVSVNAMTYTPKDDLRFKEVEASCVWQMQFPSGALANCSTSYDYAGQNHIRIVCEKGSLDMEPATGYGGNRLTRGGRKEAIEVEPNNQFAAEMDHFAECILRDQQPKTGGEEGMKDVKLMMAIYEAARTGKTIRL